MEKQVILARRQFDTFDQAFRFAKFWEKEAFTESTIVYSPKYEENLTIRI